VAAVLAGAGVLVALAGLRPPPPVIATGTESADWLMPGEVALPVLLSSTAVARILSPGDVVDIVGLAVTTAAEPRATVVAAATRVLEVPDGSGSLGSSGTAVVLVAVDADAALAVSTVMAEGPVSVHIRSRSTTG
jgi:hypothetical protein